MTLNYDALVRVLNDEVGMQRANEIARRIYEEIGWASADRVKRSLDECHRIDEEVNACRRHSEHLAVMRGLRRSVRPFRTLYLTLLWKIGKRP